MEALELLPVRNNMGLKIETWSIAYRKKKSGLLFNDSSGFKVINNGHKGWYADPFLFDYEGKTYLFAEFFSYDIGRGVLVYAVYDDEKDSFSDVKEIIREDYHLSYPFVFKGDDGKIYMIPESNESNELYLYRAVSFPDKWEKHKVILNNIKTVDTTPFMYKDKHYAFSLELDDNMLLLEFDSDFNIKDKTVLSNDMSYARAGGRVFEYNGKQIYVAQDCKEEYGRAINLIEFDLSDKCFNHNLIKAINSEDVELINAKKASGIHTYNLSNKLEVIDLKYYRNSYYRVMKRIFK